MKKKEVPQDNIKTYQGVSTKALYAVDETGNYTRVSTTGWEVEETVLRDVVNDYLELADQALQRYKNGQSSPLEYYMYKNFMDIELLAQGIGMFKWRVKRHMRPAIFNSLNKKITQKYADFFNITPEELTNIKDTDTHE